MERLGISAIAGKGRAGNHTACLGPATGAGDTEAHGERAKGKSRFQVQL